MLQKILSKLNKKNKISLKKALKLKEEVFNELKKMHINVNNLQKIEEVEKKYAKICKIILKANVDSGQNNNIKLRESLIRRYKRLLTISPTKKIKEYLNKTNKEINTVTKKQERINNNYYVKI